MIRRDELQRKLVRAAQVRSAISLISIAPALVIIAALINGGIIPQPALAIVVPLIYFGTPFVVSAIVTRFYCRRIVRCPECNTCLWDCGTGNFKPRRMRVREEAVACPSCGEPIQ